MTRQRIHWPMCLALLLGCVSFVAQAQDTEALAKQLANPIASLTSVVVLNIGYSKISRIGKQLVSYQGGVRYYMEAPNNGAEWGLRFTFTLLYPKK